jgi:NHL repeat
MRRSRSKSYLTGLLLACALVLAPGAAQAQAAPKGAVNLIGSPGNAGGQFNTPRGVAVNQANGDVYVVDSSNHRIHRFDALGTFVSAWGRDVVRTGAPENVPVNERQTVTRVATGGTFTLAFSGQTTGPIAFDATAAAVQAALEELSNIEPGDVVVTGNAGGPWTLEFAGTYANTDVAQMTGNATNLTGTPKSVTVATTVQGEHGAFEVCTMALNCKEGVAGLATDGIGGELSSPQGIAVDQADGSVYVTDQGNLRVQKFGPDGSFVHAIGKDVTIGGSTLEEICTVSANCKPGAQGGRGGEFAGAGSNAFPAHPAVNPINGNLVVPDPANRRVQQFDASGGFVRAWGFDVVLTGRDGNVPVNEQQTVTVAATGGTFTLTFSGQTTAGIPFDATAAAVQTALEALSNLNPGDVLVSGNTGGPWTVEFAGARADADVGQMFGNPANLTGIPRFASIATTTPGAGAFEVCSASANCKAAASAGSRVGQFGNGKPTRVAVDSTGSVYTLEPAVLPDVSFRVQRFNSGLTAVGVFAEAHTSGTGQDTSPTDVAVDPATDNVLVTKPDSSSGAVDQRVLEFNANGTLVETHASGGGLPVTNGLAVRGSTGRIYLPTSDDHRVIVLGEVATRPSVDIPAVSQVTATSARFEGTVNPNGGAAELPTGYHFEYSDDAGLTWTPVPTRDAVVGNGTTPENVSQDATGLEPNTPYRVRLVASRPFGGGTVTSDVATFTTPPAAPGISEVDAREVTDTTAVLAGRVDPNRQHTTYRFEYGTGTGYGSVTPIDSAGSGPRGVPALKTITGLAPGTTYHFRLVATNPSGATEGADMTFTTAPAPPPSSGRAYELVSPLDKNGGHVERDLEASLGGYQTGAATSGDAVAFASSVTFGEAESGSVLANSTYMAVRGTSGWTTEGITPPVGGVVFIGTEHPRVRGLALDARKAFSASGALLTPDAERLNGSWGLYMRAFGQPFDQRYTLLSSPPSLLEDEDDEAGRFDFEATSRDARRVVFSSSRQLLPGAPADALQAQVPNSVYEWVDGTLRLVSVPPPGYSLVPNRSATAGANGDFMSREGVLHGDHVMSEDGRRVFWKGEVRQGTSGPGSLPQLFVRENGSQTRLVSGSQPPGDDPLAGRVQQFWSARRSDGGVAFFTSTVPLTADADTNTSAGALLYRWDASRSEDADVTLLSRDDAGNERVLGPTAVSDDASTAYFVARGVLAPGGMADEPNLYVWREGQGMRYVATVDGTEEGTFALDSPMWRLEHRRMGSRAGRTTPDGDRLLFASYAQLDPDYDITEDTPEACGDPEVAGESCRQIYLYDATSGETSCLTCVAGVPVTGDANLFGDSDPRSPKRNVDAPLSLPRNLSDDGRRAFFETNRQLVTADEDSAIDVYEWEDGDLDGEGELRLLSAGRSESDSVFLDASENGDDVFFLTRERLVGIDTDSQVDLYDARVGGGFASQHPSSPPTPCDGEGCQGSTSGSPFLPGIASGGATGGDARPGARPSFSVARLSRAQRARLAAGRPVMVPVRVSRAGRVSLTARAKLGGRMRAVATASKTASKAGTVRLRLRLSMAARRQLARGRPLALRMSVRFAGVREARTSTVRLRRASPSGERSGR